MKSRQLKLYIFYCSNSLDTESLLQIGDDEVKAISLPCSGKADVLYMMKAFETGADGVIVVTCRKDECRFLEGNLRAQKRADSVDELLQETGLGKGRIAVIQLKEGGTKQLIEEIGNFCAEVREMLNPVFG